MLVDSESNIMQQQQFWVGVFFAAAFVVFLMYSINKGKDLNSGQRLMLKILSALCAGIGAWLIAGEAFFNLSRDLPGGKLTVSGTAGFAIFLTIWFTFPKGPKFEPLPDRFKMSVPPNLTFQMIADACAQQDLSVTQYDGFSEDERLARIKEWKLEAETVAKAIELLGSITEVPGAVRDYEVTKNDSKYLLRVKG
jgi:hypothetical protein